MKPVILASTSPRRRELLTAMGIPIIIVPPTFDENIQDVPNTASVTEYFSKEKALSIVPLIEGKHLDADIIIGSDTIILLDDAVLGKPKSELQARCFLQRISGRKHIVETGITCYNRKTKEIKTAVSQNSVNVKAISDNEIDWYIAKNEWIDAAGAYKIQGLFQRFITSIEGTQSSIMGLPLFEIFSILESYNYDFS